MIDYVINVSCIPLTGRGSHTFLRTYIVLLKCQMVLESVFLLNDSLVHMNFDLQINVWHKLTIHTHIRLTHIFHVYKYFLKTKS